MAAIYDILVSKTPRIMILVSELTFYGSRNPFVLLSATLDNLKLKFKMTAS